MNPREVAIEELETTHNWNSNTADGDSRARTTLIASRRIGFALLDVADAIRELATAVREKEVR